MIRYEKQIVLAYNTIAQRDCTGIEQIPDCALQFLICIPYNELVGPSIIKELKKGRTLDQCCIKFGVSRSVVRRHGRSAGLLKR